MSGLRAALIAGLVLAAIGCAEERLAANVPDGGAGGTGTGGTGTGGAGGGDDAGPDTGTAPVRLIRGDPAGTFVTCNFEARGLPAEDEGRAVILRLGFPDRPPERLVAAEARVEDGAFRIEAPLGCERSLYKRK